MMSTATARKLADNVDRMPVKLKRTDMARIRVAGNMPTTWVLKTHATREEILSPGWFNPMGDLMYVDETIIGYYGPDPFDIDMANEPNYRGGAKRHAKIYLDVVGKTPVHNELSGKITSWVITVEVAG